MKHIKRIFEKLRMVFAFATLLLVASCSSTPTKVSIDDSAWAFANHAIEIRIKAPSDLNSVSGRPHSIAIGVFQLNDPNTFTGLSSTPQGAVQLLQKGRIDDTVASFNLINVRPGEERLVALNRAQTAQYVGVIAGYFNLNPKKDVKLFPIPVKLIKQGLVEKLLVMSTLVAGSAQAVPTKLKVYADLGRDSSRQIIEVGGTGLNAANVGSGGGGSSGGGRIWCAWLDE